MRPCPIDPPDEPGTHVAPQGRDSSRAARWARVALAPLVAAGLCLAASGCGSGKLDVAPVKGKVTHNKKPLQFGSVVFQSEKGLPATGQIQPDGTYTLTTYASGDGAVVGSHKVQITCTDTQKPGFTPPAGQELPVGKSLIPTKYNQADTSGLTAEVKSGPNQIDFDLKDD